jgi:hypothetical protein
MVLRAQGADPEAVRRRRPGAVSVAEQAVAQGAGLVRPVVVSGTFAVAELRHEQLRLEGGGHLAGPLIAQHLRAAESVAVAVCTIGPALEEAVAACFGDDPALGVALDAFGSVMVDLLATAMCQGVDSDAAAQGLRTTVPLSPGLVGWPLANGQRQVFALVDAASAGVSLTPGCLMMPQKSTSLVIGIGADVEHAGETCDYCSMATTCRYRQEHISHLA